MQTFNELRKYIIDNLDNIGAFVATDKNSKTEYKAVYLIEKPEQHTLTSGNCLIIKFNEVDGGKAVRHFAVEIKIMSKDISDLIATKDALVNMLDFYNRPCAIPDYRKFRLSNEGGIYFDENNLMYVDKLLFDCKAI